MKDLLRLLKEPLLSDQHSVVSLLVSHGPRSCSQLVLQEDFTARAKPLRLCKRFRKVEAGANCPPKNSRFSHALLLRRLYGLVLRPTLDFPRLPGVAAARVGARYQAVGVAGRLGRGGRSCARRGFRVARARSCRGGGRSGLVGQATSASSCSTSLAIAAAFCAPARKRLQRSPHGSVVSVGKP